MGTSGTPIEYVFYVVEDVYGCTRLLTQIYLTPTKLYRSKIPVN